MMYGAHDWLSAIAIANKKAKASGRKQRVVWSADWLLWLVYDLAADPRRWAR